MKRFFAVATFAVLGIVVLTLLLQRGATSIEAQAQGTCIPPVGKYAFSGDGQLLQGNGSHVGPVAWAGYMSFNNGKVTGVDTVNYADKSPVARGFSGTYTMRTDCSVTVGLVFSGGGDSGGSANFVLYFADSGRQFRFVQTDIYRVDSGSGIRVN